MARKRAVICSQNGFSTDYRVFKLSETLRESGYEVTLLGRRHPRRDESEREGVSLMRLLFWRGPLFYAEFNWRLALRLLFGKRYDLVVSIDLDTLPGCVIGSKLRGERLLFDSHEYFPGMPEIAHKPFVKWVWGKMADIFIPKADILMTVCSSVARLYCERSGGRKYDFIIVRNVPLSSRAVAVQAHERHDGSFNILYQGAVNVGRGVEEAVEALPSLPGCRLTVVGDGDVMETVRGKVAELHLESRVSIVGRKAFSELPPYMAEADLGLVVLRDMSENYHSALPNRLFDFIHAGLPVVGSDLPEIAAVVRGEDIGVCIEELTPKAIVEAVGYAMHHPEKMQAWRQNMKRIAPAYVWERDAAPLKEALSR